VTVQLPPLELDAGREAELTVRIDRWLAHMTWRPDYTRWREGRIWQERVQAGRLELIARYGGALAAGASSTWAAAWAGPAWRWRWAARALAFSTPEYCDIIRLRAARYGLPLPIVNGAGDNCPRRRGFDLAICWDVVEHMRDPSGCVAGAGLRPGGARCSVIQQRLPRPTIICRAHWLPRRWPVAIARRGRGRSARRSATGKSSRRCTTTLWPASGGARRAGPRRRHHADRVRRGGRAAGKGRRARRCAGWAWRQPPIIPHPIQGTFELLLVHD
jgi:hypothetical protein